MGLVGAAALVGRGFFVLPWAYRAGDSNMQSVWLCSRNDVVGNCAVLLAALGVFGARQVVALVMGLLALQGAWLVSRTASRELTGVRA